MDWVRNEMGQGNTSAAELLFRHDAGLTPEQHLAEIDPQAMESLIAAETDVTKRDEMLKGYA